MTQRKDQIIHDQNSDYIPVTQVKREKPMLCQIIQKIMSSQESPNIQPRKSLQPISKKKKIFKIRKLSIDKN